MDERRLPPCSVKDFVALPSPKLPYIHPPLPHLWMQRHTAVRSLVSWPWWSASSVSGPSGETPLPLIPPGTTRGLVGRAPLSAASRPGQTLISVPGIAPPLLPMGGPRWSPKGGCLPRGRQQFLWTAVSYRHPYRLLRRAGRPRSCSLFPKGTRARPFQPPREAKERHCPLFYVIECRQAVMRTRLSVRPPQRTSRVPSLPGATRHPSSSTQSNITPVLEPAPNRSSLRRTRTWPSATATSGWTLAAILQKAPWWTWSAFTLEVSGTCNFVDEGSRSPWPGCD